MAEHTVTFDVAGEAIRVPTGTLLAEAAHQAGVELQEVPFCACRLQYFQRIDSNLVENNRQFVHQCNVQVALRVLDHLAGLGDLDACGAVYARSDDALVKPGHLVQGFWRVAGDHLDHIGEHVLAVTWVDALRAVADEEVAFPDQA
jgi:hypothetical protein